VIQWQVNVVNGRVSICCGFVAQLLVQQNKSRTNRSKGVWAYTEKTLNNLAEVVEKWAGRTVDAVFRVTFVRRPVRFHPLYTPQIPQIHSALIGFISSRILVSESIIVNLSWIWGYLHSAQSKWRNGENNRLGLDLGWGIGLESGFDYFRHCAICIAPNTESLNLKMKRCVVHCSLYLTKGALFTKGRIRTTDIARTPVVRSFYDILYPWHTIQKPAPWIGPFFWRRFLERVSDKSGTGFVWFQIPAPIRPLFYSSQKLLLSFPVSKV